ncbi:hypothetical protein MKX01_011066 [Papaver californicum]|nr:hypothetical protein MKX01_011066 [Papaver californicum]
MTDQENHHHHHHHHLHRPNRLSLPSRNPNFSTTTASGSTTTSRQYPLYSYSSSLSTPTPTPSKQRLTSINSRSSSSSNANSLSFLFLLLFSLRSLYSLLPFLRSSSPSFSIFPFSFLVSLCSFLLTFSFSLFSSSSKSQQKIGEPIFSITSITPAQKRLLFSKSIVLAVVFLLRFQALRYCGTSATILAEFTGNVAGKFVFEGGKNHRGGEGSNASKVRGFLALFIGLFLLSISWDRIECFPIKGGVFMMIPGENCYRVMPMLLPFLSGFLGSYERVSMNWGTIRQLGRKRVRLICLFFTTIVLFFPAIISFFLSNEGRDGVSILNLGWPLANTVVFGVLLTENFGDDSKLTSSKDFQRNFVVTFVCTLVLELFYFPELSLWGLLLCGFLLWISVRELASSSNYPELGSDASESFSSMTMKPIRHILSERKSRKIALFLLINTLYMVVEFVAGFMSNSLGLISDACHMLFDCAALAIGLYASYISRLPANGQFNYGRGRFEVLSGYVNAVFLVLVGALIVLESLERILDPQEISTSSLLTVSIGGLLVNMVGLIFFHEEHHHAHGGGGCSHSHSQSPHFHSHDHDHVVHDHGSPENHNHNGHSHHSNECGGTHKIEGTASHNDQKCNNDHHGHTQKHDHHDHHHDAHHSHETPVTSSSSLQQHSHESCTHSTSHSQDKACSHRDHLSSSSTHSHQLDLHAHHSHETTITSSSSLQQHSHEGCTHSKSHSQDKACSHSDHLSSSSTHSHQLDLHHQSSEHNQLKEKLLETNPLKVPQKHHRHVDHNMEGIFLHVLADTMGSVGVVISTLLIKYKGWLAADPICSIFISVLIVSSVISLLRNSAEVLLQRIPRAHEGDLKVALDDVFRISGVRSMDNVHVWSFTNTEVIGTLNLHVSTDTDKASTKSQVSHILGNAGIKDLTIQVEYVKES